MSPALSLYEYSLARCYRSIIIWFNMPGLVVVPSLQGQGPSLDSLLCV